MGESSTYCFKWETSRKASMKKILADTNFLITQYEYRVDLPSELRRIVHEPITLVIASGAMDELKTLAGRAGKKASGARFVLQNMGRLREKFTVEIAPSRGEVDGWIFKFAKENEPVKLSLIYQQDSSGEKAENSLGNNNLEIP